jgi:hypothetical protein
VGRAGTLCKARTPELLRTPCSAGEGELKPAKLRCRGCMTLAQLHCAAGRRASMLQVWGDTAPGPVLPAKRPLACTYNYADDTDVGVRRTGHLAAPKVWQLGTAALEPSSVAANPQNPA